MKCEEFITLLPLYPDALPGGAQTARDIQAHAAQCPECAAKLSRQEALLSALQTLDEGLTVPEAFGEAWRNAVAGDSGPARPARKHRRRIWALTAAAVSVLVCGTILMRSGWLFSPPQLDKRATYSAENSPASQADMAAVNFYAMDDAQTSDGMLPPQSEAGSLSGAASGAPILLRTASITLDTEQYDADVEQIQALLSETGGWSEYWSVHGEPLANNPDGGRFARLTLRIPVEALDQFVSAIDEIGKVTGSQITTEDISESYYDIQGRLAMYEAQRDRFTQLLAQAQSVGELMEIESRLNELQYTIESLVGRLNNWTSLSANAMVSLSITEVPSGGAFAKSSVTQRMQRAFSLSVAHARGFLGDMLVFFIMIAPYLLFVALPILAVYLIIRINAKYRQRRKEI